MTFFEFIVPVIALTVAGAGVLILRQQERKLDKHPTHRHPAE